MNTNEKENHSTIEPQKRADYIADLARVTTIGEATKHWGLSKSTLIRWCNEGHVSAIKPHGADVWLLSVAHLIALLGMPMTPDGELNALDRVPISE